METEDEKLKRILKEVLKEENPKWITIAEKIIIPFLLAVVTFVLGLTSWITAENNTQLDAKRLHRDTLNTKEAIQRDIINHNQNVQLALVQLLYKDFTSGNKKQAENAMSMVSLMDTSFRRKLSQVLVNIDDKVEGRQFLRGQANVVIRYAKIIVYSNDDSREKAQELTNLLQGLGADCKFLGKPKDFALRENEIVYYDISQINYCEVVREWLLGKNFGNYTIRSSSLAGTKNNHFKIYVVE